MVENHGVFTIRGLIIGLALLHGMLYANFLPPWGLIDEAQHVHYIQYVAQNGRSPLPQQTLLSDAIIDSLFVTHHWQTFHWPTPVDRSLAQLGTVAYSYEAYHPPLFYWLLAPLDYLLPADVLAQAFLLRWAMVLLSLCTLWFLDRTARILLTDRNEQILAAALLIALPERTFAVSRVNNDVLLEVFCALFIWLCTSSIMGVFSRRRVVMMALLIGLGLWVKLSMIGMLVPFILYLWFERGQKDWKTSLFWAIFLLLGLGGGVFVRNLVIFGEPTGYSSFHQLHPLAIPELTAINLLSALYDLFRHTWVIWWKGALAATNWVLVGFYLWFSIITIGSLIQIAQQLQHNVIFALTYTVSQLEQSILLRHDKVAALLKINQVLLLYLATVATYAGLTLVSYFRGFIPVIQGRFLLPAILPIVIIIVWGWRKYRYGKLILTGCVVSLFLLDILSIGGNLLPYFYDWSEVVNGVNGNVTNPFSQWSHFYQQLSADKPAFVVHSLPFILAAYGLLLLIFIRFLLKSLQTK